MPGTRLVREWIGEVRRVTVLETGFHYNGIRYNSLSQIARNITGALVWAAVLRAAESGPPRRGARSARMPIGVELGLDFTGEESVTVRCRRDGLAPWPCPVAQKPGLRAVGTPCNGRGATTMESLMAQKTPRSPKSVTSSGTQVKASAPRGRQRTKTQIALSLLERSKGASIADMQNAMGWQAHSVRGFLAGTIRKMPGLTLVSDKTYTGPRRYRIQAAAQ